MRFCQLLVLILILTINIYKVFALEKSNLEEINQITSKIKLNEIEKFLTKNDDGSPCLLQLLWMVQGLVKGELWALKIFDSWAKPNAGYLSGNLVAIGAYDQCLKISYNTTSNIEFNGQYCNVVFLLQNGRNVEKLKFQRRSPDALTTSLTFGICIPRVCDPKYIKTILDEFGRQSNIQIGDYDQELNCNNGINPKFTTADILAISILSIIGSLIVASTIYDIATLQNGQRIELLLAFSFYTNLIKLFKTTSQSNNNNNNNMIGCLNGIRCLSMIWVIFCHRVTSFLRGPLINLIYLDDWIKNYSSTIVIAGGVAVDTFFILSGFLITRSILKELDRKKSINIPYMYLHRYLRLTPSLAMLIFMHVTLYKYIGSGPFWKVGVDFQAEPCTNKWWATLLYFQNYYKNLEGRCMDHSWYLAIDMQLFILSPLFIWPLWKFGRKALVAIVGILCLWLITNFTYFIMGQYHYSLGAADDRILRTYEAIHTRMGPWIVGLLLAYLLYYQKGREIRLNWKIVAIGWTVSLGLIAALIFGIQPLSQVEYQNHSQWEDTMYGTFSIFAWSLSVSWIIYACINGYGGFVNKFLSWTFWQPLAKLTYSMYLLHFPLQFTDIYGTKTHFNFSNVNSAYTFWGNLGFTLTVAIIWTLAFESPIIIIEKYVFGRGTVRKIDEKDEKA